MIMKFLHRSPIQDQTVTVEQIRYYLIMGQSNIDGRNDIVDLPATVPNPNPNAKHYWQSNFKNWQPNGGPPFQDAVQSTFAADSIFLELMKQYTSKTQYAVKRSAGGTSFASPNVKGVWNITNGDLYFDFKYRIENLISYIKYLKATPAPIFLWCDIGETDSSDSNKDTFKRQFKEFIREVRKIVGRADLPVVHRKLQLIQSGVNQWFLDAQDEFADGEINDYYLIDETYTLQDAYHLDAASSIQYADDVFQLTKDW